MASASWEKTSTQALMSEVQLLAWAMATGAPDGVATRSISSMRLRSGRLQHDHGEGGGAGGDVAGARAHRVGGDHAGAGVALGRAQRDAGPQGARRVERGRAGLGQAPVVVSSTPWAARRPFAGAAWAAPINGVRRRRRSAGRLPRWGRSVPGAGGCALEAHGSEAEGCL